MIFQNNNNKRYFKINTLRFFCLMSLSALPIVFSLSSLSFSFSLSSSFSSFYCFTFEIHKEFALLLLRHRSSTAPHSARHHRLYFQNQLSDSFVYLFVCFFLYFVTIVAFVAVRDRYRMHFRHYCCCCCCYSCS